MEKIKLIDVGARGGIHTRWTPYFSDLDVLAFEPEPIECESLNQKQWPYKVTYLPYALGERDGEKAILHVTRSPGSSSLLKPNLDLLLEYPYGHNLDVIREIPLQLSRMDSVCKGYRPDVVKLDTQGTELQILRGAGDLLDTMIAVEVEVEFLPLYQNQPLFSDVEIFMRSKGFTLRAIRRTFWRHKANYSHAFGGQLMHGDALFLRLPLLNTAKGHTILAAYRQYDLLDFFGATHLIPKRTIFQKLVQKCFGRFNGTMMRGLLNKTRPPSDDDWHDYDFF